MTDVVTSQSGAKVEVSDERLIEIMQHLTKAGHYITDEQASIAAELLELRKRTRDSG